MLSVLVALLSIGCSKPELRQATPPVPTASAPAPEPLPVPAPEAQPQPALRDRGANLTPDDLLIALRDIANTGEGTVAARVVQAFDTRPEPDAVVVTEGDLDGDGVPEAVTAPKPSHPINGAGAIYVIYRKGGNYEVDRTADAPDTQLPLTGVRLHGLRDIDGDGRPEIVWSTTELVAHGPPSLVFVTHWAPGHFTNLPGTPGMLSMTLQLDGSDIVLSGGGVGGNSGPGQASRTDRYRWVDGQVRLVERTMANPDSDGYTWLQQAISDEDLGKPERAAEAYRRVLEPGRPVIIGFYSVDPTANEEAFNAAVRDLAGFRLGLLLLDNEQQQAAEGLKGALVGARTRAQACQAASAWMTAHAEFGQALNGLFGYAHPVWKPENVCGALHQATPFVTAP